MKAEGNCTDAKRHVANCSLGATRASEYRNAANREETTYFKKTVLNSMLAGCNSLLYRPGERDFVPLKGCPCNGATVLSWSVS